MRQDPDDVQGWRLLANAYMALGQHSGDWRGEAALGDNIGNSVDVVIDRVVE
jgi:hypothetical protein